MISSKGKRLQNIIINQNSAEMREKHEYIDGKRFV